MSWPHDPDGMEGSEGGRKYGLALFAKKLDAEDFPLSVEDCIDRFGEDPIRLDHERVVPAHEILSLLETERFEEKQAFLAAVGAVMRAGGFWTFERERYTPV